MDAVKNIITENLTTSFTYETDDIAKVNLLRRAMLGFIDTYAIEFAVFFKNTSPRLDEIISLRLGQCPIDHANFVPPEDPNHRYRISVKGPATVTSDDIQGIPFKYTFPIVELRDGQELICDCIVRQGQAKTHVKWRPISTFVIIGSDETGFQLQFDNVGMYEPEEIIEKGLAKMEEAAQETPVNLFFQPLLPQQL